MIPQHLSLSNEHYTPADITGASRYVMGRIDLDPASCAKANETVQAIRYIALPQDGLVEEWEGRVFLNPPGGTLTLTEDDVNDAIMKAMVVLGVDEGLPHTLSPEQRKKWRKHPLVKYELSPIEERLAAEREKWKTTSRSTAWWRKLVISYEKGSVTQAVFVAFTLEMLRSAQDESDSGHPFDYSICVPRDRLHFGGDSPTHANFIVYMGPYPQLFKDTFSQFGRCKL